MSAVTMVSGKGLSVVGQLGAPEVYGAHHGGFLPTRNEDISSSFGTMLLAGPGIKKGYERDYDSHGYIHAADVVPTFCHILGTAPPAHRVKAQLLTICLKETRWRESEMPAEYVSKIYRHLEDREFLLTICFVM